MRRETEIRIEIQCLELTIENYKKQGKEVPLKLESMIEALKWVLKENERF